MSKPGATSKQKNCIKRIAYRFDINVTTDRLTFIDVEEASKSIEILKRMEKLADWLEEKSIDPEFDNP